MYDKNLLGKKFNRLTIQEYSGVKNHVNHFLCLCDCGNKSVVAGYWVKSGRIKSCGCLRRDIKTSHGFHKERFYRIYKLILSRCNNKNNKIFNRYGGRNIRCLWSSFESFKDDMYSDYLLHVAKFGEKQTTIDRIDNDGNYCKENCRWATRVIQNNNNSRNRLLNYQGKTYTMAELARKLGVKYHIINSRIHRGWSIERTVNTK